MAPCIHQTLPILQSLIIIQTKQSRSCTSDRRPPGNVCAGQFKMILPVHCSRIKKRRDFTAQRVNGGKVGTFVDIADGTGKRQVFRNRQPVMSARKYVVYRVCFRPVVLMNQAVLTTPAGALNNKSSQINWDAYASHEEKKRISR